VGKRHFLAFNVNISKTVGHTSKVRDAPDPGYADPARSGSRRDPQNVDLANVDLAGSGPDPDPLCLGFALPYLLMLT